MPRGIYRYLYVAFFLNICDVLTSLLVRVRGRVRVRVRVVMY